MELADLPRIVRRRWPVIACLTIIVMALAWVSTPDPKSAQRAEREQVTYRAEHVLLVDPEVARGNGLGRLALFATTGGVPERANERLGGDGTPTRGAGNDQSSKKSTKKASGKQPQVHLGSTTVTVRSDPTDGSMVFSAVDDDAERAVMAANVLAEELVKWNNRTERARYEDQLTSALERQQSLEDRIAVIQFQLAGANPVSAETLTSQLRAVSNELASVEQQVIQLQGEGAPSRDITTLQAASSAVAVRESSKGLFKAPTDRVARMAIAAVLGLLLSLGLVLGLERLDTSVRNAAMVESAANLPVIAEVPHAPTGKRNRYEVALIARPASLVAEAYRGLRTSISLMWLASGRGLEREAIGSSSRADNPHGFDDDEGDGASGMAPKVVLVTSPGANEGKSVTAANLAVGFAEAGRSVILLDLDFRAAHAHHYLAGGRSPNLADLDDAETGLDEILQPTAVTGLRFAAAVKSDEQPATAVATARAAITAAAAGADVVVLDAPPLLLANDAYDLMADADALVLVVREGRTKRGAVRRAGQLLRRLDAPIIGVALVGAHESSGRVTTGAYGKLDRSATSGPLARLTGRFRRSERERDDLIRLS